MTEKWICVFVHMYASVGVMSWSGVLVVQQDILLLIDGLRV